MRKIKRVYKVNKENGFFVEKITNPFVKALAMQCIEYTLEDGVTLCRTIATEQVAFMDERRTISLPLETQTKINNVWVTQVTENEPVATANEFIKIDTQQLVKMSEALESFYDIDREILQNDGTSYEPKQYFKTTVLKDGYLSTFDNHIFNSTGESGNVSVHEVHKATIIEVKGLSYAE